MQGVLRHREWMLLPLAALVVGLGAFVLLAHNVAQARPDGIDAWKCLERGGSGPWLGHCPERMPVSEVDRSIRTGIMVGDISDLHSITGILEFDPRYLEIVGTVVDRERNDPCVVAPNVVATPDNNAGALNFSAIFDPPLGDGCTVFLIDWKVKRISPSGVVTPTFSLHTMVNSQGEEIPHHTKPSDGCVVSGTVKLDGRTDHSGTVVMLSTQKACPTNWKYSAQADYPGFLTTTTDSLGDFALDSDGRSCRCLFAYKQGYLTGQAKPPMKDQVVKAPLKLLAGDATGDDAVNIFDLALIARCLGKDDPVGDINGDGKCNIYDLSLAAKNMDKPRGPQEWQ